MGYDTGVQIINRLASIEWPENDLANLPPGGKSLWLGKAFGLNESCGLQEAIAGIGHLVFSHSATKSIEWQQNTTTVLDRLWKLYSSRLSLPQVQRMMIIINRIKEVVKEVPALSNPISQVPTPHCLTKCALTFSINEKNTDSENITISERIISKVHPGTLAASSPFFSDFFYGPMKNLKIRRSPDQADCGFEASLNDAYNIPISTKAFEEFIKWADTGEHRVDDENKPKIDVENIVDFFSLCHYYRISGSEHFIPQFQEYFLNIYCGWLNNVFGDHKKNPCPPLCNFKTFIESAISNKVLAKTYVKYETCVEKAIRLLIVCMIEDPQILKKRKKEVEEILFLAKDHTRMIDLTILSDLAPEIQIKTGLTKEILEFIIFRLNNLQWLDASSYQHFIEPENYRSTVRHPSLVFLQGLITVPVKNIQLNNRIVNKTGLSRKQTVAAYMMMIDGIPMKMARYYAEKNQSISVMNNLPNIKNLE